MDYQKYRAGIFSMWKHVSSEEFFSFEFEEKDGKEYVMCGLCDPEFGVSEGRTAEQECPFDNRSENDGKPCMDNCYIFVNGTAPHKLKIIMSKFMTKFVTKEGIESLKSLAKACRGQKGTSKEAAVDFITIANKVITSTERFGGYEFEIVSGKLKAKRRME